MSDPVSSAILFLITTIFDLYTFVLMVRLVLVAVRADFFNPLSQVIIKLTQFIILPLRRVIPNYKNIELASVALLLVIEIIKCLFIGLISEPNVNFPGIIVLACADILKSLVYLFLYAIVLQAIMSWVNQGYSALGVLLARITAPIMRPFQRIIPPIASVDVSPIAVIIVLQLLIILIISPLYAFGLQMAFT
jgi:YggT family protein